jgi:hypothetical protein
MANSVAAVSDNHSPAPPRSAMIRGILLDVAPPLVAYYGLRAAGASEYIALLTATVLSGVKVSYDAVKARRLDPFAGYLMLNFGLSLAVGLATSDARLLLTGNALVNGIGGLIFLGSCVIGKPLTRVVAERIRPDDDEDEPGEIEFKHRVHILLSAIWGFGLLVGMVTHLILIFTLSVDVANAAGTATSLATTALLIGVTIMVARKARARWEQRSPSQG